MRRPLPSLTVLALSLLLVGAASAQASLDIALLNRSTRAPLAGLTVRLTNESIGLRLEARSDAQGRARFDGLSTAGAYVVEAPATAGFYANRTSGLELRQGATRSVNLLLNPVTAVELPEVDVTGEASIASLNRSNAEVSSTLTPREIQALPIEGRDLTRALYRLPNVTQATGFYPEAPNVSVNGANGLFVNYLIDGLDNNEQFLGGQRFAIPIGFVQNVTVLTNTFSAEYGRTGNGVFNVTTKSGGNEVTGEAFYLTRPGPRIDGEIGRDRDLTQRDLLGNPVKDGFQRQQFGFAAGGPVRRDRTFYFVNVEQTFDLKDNRLTAPGIGIDETVRGQNRFTYASAKLDQVWSGQLRSSLRGNLGLVRNDRQGGGLEGGVQFPSAGNAQVRNSANAALTNTYAAGRAVFESNFLYGFFRWDYGRGRADRSQAVVLGPDDATVAVVGNPGYVFDESAHTLQTQQKVTVGVGRHTLRAGLDVLSTDHELFGGGNPNGNYTVRLTQAQLDALRTRGRDLNVDDIPANATVLNYNVELAPKAFGVRQTNYAAYVEDAFTPLAGLNVTLGLRYDVDNLSKGGGTKYDLNNVAPRVAFNLALDARSVVRGGYGLFYDKVLYAIYSDALQQNSTSAGYRSQLQALVGRGLLPADTDLDRVTFDGNASASLAGVAFGQGPTADQLQGQRENLTFNELRLLNPDGYANPYAHQFSVGYQRELPRRTLFYVDLVRAEGRNLFRLRNLNAPSAYTPNPGNVVVRTQAQADATRPVAVVPGGAKNIVMTETGGRSRYTAASVNLVRDRQPDEPFFYRLAYTLSRLNNDTEDINFRAQNANDFRAEYGPSINDRTHVLSGVVYYTPARVLTFSFATLLQSGQPINRIPDGALYGTTDLNGDGRSFGDAYVGNSDRQPGEDRNSDRLPWSTNFDVGASVDLPVAGQRLELRADVFNIFNTENLSGYANNATQSNQIQAGPASSGVLVRRNAGPPRQFQFGLRVAF